MGKTLAFVMIFAANAHAAELEKAKYFGCWETAQITKCGRTSGKVCFGARDKMVHSGYSACESDGFEEKFSYKVASGLLTLSSDIRKLEGFCHGNVNGNVLELSCDEAIKDFDGKYGRLCNQLNAQGTDCGSGQPKDPGGVTAKDKID
jgi:hypothetical protein